MKSINLIIHVKSITKEIIKIRNEFKGFRLPSFEEISNALVVTSQDSAIDYTITYNGETYRVISNAGDPYQLSDLDGYQLLVSNTGRTDLENKYIAQNEICVLKK